MTKQTYNLKLKTLASCAIGLPYGVPAGAFVLGDKGYIYDYGLLRWGL